MLGNNHFEPQLGKTLSPPNNPVLTDRPVLQNTIIIILLL